MKTDVAVVYSPVGGGHKAAALATAEAARARGLAVELIDLFEYAPRIVGDTILAAHLSGQRSLPALYGYSFFATNRRDGAFEPVRLALDNLFFAKLARHVRELAPRVVVATHHLPLVVLGHERLRGRLASPVVGVVTDYTTHAAWAEEGVDAFCVPSARAGAELAEHGVARARIRFTGIPVRAAFQTMPSAQDPTSGERTHVLITSGGFGVGPIRAIVRSFTGVAGVELTVVCGSDAALYEKIHEDVALAGLDARIIGFERDMAARLAEAHVVVGKAGGLTVSETLTAGRPMIMAGTPPGNETANEAFVVDGGAGFASLPHRVGELIPRMRADRAIGRMGRAARRLVVADAGARVVEAAWKLALERARRAA